MTMPNRLALLIALSWLALGARGLQHDRGRRQGRQGRRRRRREGREIERRPTEPSWNPFASVTRAGRAARPRQRRHRRHHPEAVPEVDQAVGLRPEPVRRVALSRSRRARHGQQRAPSAQSRFRAERAALPGREHPARAPQLRLRQLARARAVGARRLRLPRADRAVVRRHLLQQLLQERPPADRAHRIAGGPAVRRREGVSRLQARRSISSGRRWRRRTAR